MHTWDQGLSRERRIARSVPWWTVKSNVVHTHERATKSLQSSRIHGLYGPNVIKIPPGFVWLRRDLISKSRRQKVGIWRGLHQLDLWGDGLPSSAVMLCF